MSKQGSDTRTRLDELLLEQAIHGLSDRQQVELDALADAADWENPYMETAALVQLGLAVMEHSARGASTMPAELRNKLQRLSTGS